MAGVGVVLAMTLVGCADVSATLPAGTPNPSVFNSATGALIKRNAADSIFQAALTQYIVDAGLLTDELTDPNSTGVVSIVPGSYGLDERIAPERLRSGPGGQSYSLLQRVRGTTNEAIGALAKYDSTAPPALRGEMYALQGYAEVMLAELFCSGVPLSTYDYGGDFTYKPSSTQQQVYQDAIAKFDTVLALSSDSARILNLARVGLGRAYLALGDYTNAAAVVASVPDNFRYQVNVQWQDLAGQYQNLLNRTGNISDQEGENGMPFISSGDPRTQDTAVGPVVNGVQLYFPRKYLSGLSSPYYSPVSLADGIEARLIQAEAALQAGDPSWLTTLNALRTAGGATMDTVADTLGVTGCSNVCGYDPGNGVGGSTPAFGQPYPGGYVPPAGFTYSGMTATAGAHTVVFTPSTPLHSPQTDVKQYCYDNSWYIPCYQGDSLVILYYTKPKANPIWSAGIGGVGGLAPLSDPGNSAGDTARVNLLFRERAYWLYLTGHRQGDLRRLVRNYHRDPEAVYPTGTYFGPGTGIYGSDVTAPIPAEENPNPYFHGCLDRNA